MRAHNFLPSFRSGIDQPRMLEYAFGGDFCPISNITPFKPYGLDFQHKAPNVETLTGRRSLDYKNLIIDHQHLKADKTKTAKLSILKIYPYKKSQFRHGHKLHYFLEKSPMPFFTSEKVPEKT